ncbi:MAG TPA: dolichyl-phosphate beta-glucosyltransferase [Gemmatimonadaceae bacterium]|nr:dolichyl-phosphate beta-glucosyltransferase [Gemmatimonadaceae bacterium]
MPPRPTPAARPALSVVIPAYNEAGRLPRTLREVLDHLARAGRRAEVIVVDDGSTDETAARVLEAAAADPRVRLLQLPNNQGKGYAVRAGVLSAEGGRILFADADGATPFAELERLERCLDMGADVAIGSRNVPSTSTEVRKSLGRHLAGRLFHQLVKLLSVRGIADTQCGFKLFSQKAARDLFGRARLDRFAFDVELLLIAYRRGYSVVEVPVNWTHQPGSRINVLADGLRMAADLLRVRTWMLAGAYDGGRALAARHAAATLPMTTAVSAAAAGPRAKTAADAA